MHVSKLADVDRAGPKYAWNATMLDSICPLIARKFPANTADAVIAVLTGDDGGLGIMQQPVGV